MKLNIIIPVYNGECHLKKTLENIVCNHNKYNNFELILIDDGSTDNTKSICSYYVESYPWIKYYYKLNGGVSSARNYGLSKSNGDYVIFIDSDDYLDSNILEYIQINTINDDIVISNFIKNENGEKTFYPKKKLINLDTESILKSTVDIMGIRGFTGNKIFKRSFLRKNSILFDESLSFGEDMDFFVQALLKSPNVTYSNRLQYQYNFVTIKNKHANPQKNLLITLNKIIRMLYMNSVNKDTIIEFEKYYLYVLMSFYFNCEHNRINNDDYLEAFYFLSKNGCLFIKIASTCFNVSKDVLYLLWKIKNKKEK